MNLINKATLLFLASLFFIGCANNTIGEKEMKVQPVNVDFFIQKNFLENITKKTINLKGVPTICYVFKSNSQATEHLMGPWCPTHINDGKEKGGVWFKDGKVYDVSGHFISELDEFYEDDKWKLYREDGSIKVTKTKEGCLSAAKPDVEGRFNKQVQVYCFQFQS